MEPRFFKLSDSMPKQSQRYQFLPEIQSPPQLKSLQDVVVQTSRVSQFGKQSLLEEFMEPQTQRSDYHSIIKDKRFSLNNNGNSEQRKGLLVRFQESDNTTKDNSQPKSILKRKNSNSSQHTDIFDFFELAEPPLLTRNNKHVTLKPLQQSTVAISPNLVEQVSPKKVSFNRQIQVKLIEETPIEIPENTEKNTRHRFKFRRQMTDVVN